MAEPFSAADESARGTAALSQYLAATPNGGYWLFVPVMILWALGQRYQGIWHDGILYSFQALAHVYPNLLGGDAFLRFGSQDQYSIFSRFYALIIPALGLESAAALLTLAMQAALVLAIWQLARRLFPAPVAVFALAVTLALPSVYGEGQVFHYIENFVSPRMGAEAFALLGIGLWISGKRRAALPAWLLSCSLHVIMAAAAATFVAWFVLLERRKLALVLVLLACAALFLASLYQPWRMDPLWLGTVRSAISYLFLSDWTTEAWLTAGLPLLLLLCVYIAQSDSTIGRMAAAGAATGLAGLALSWLGGDVLHLARIIQLQPWRWMWLTALLAALLSPALACSLWRRGRLGQSALFLLASAYLLATPLDCLLLVPLILVAARVATRTGGRAISPRHALLAQRGAAALLVVALLWNLACKALLIPSLFDYPSTSSGVEKVRTLFQDGVLAVLLLLAAVVSWHWLQRRACSRSWYATWALPLVLSISFNLPGWWERNYNAPLQSALARWQDIIPERSEVFIPEEPLLSLALLLRPSYFSAPQTVSEVFSRAAAVEFRARAIAAKDFLGANGLQPWPDLRATDSGDSTLPALCAGTGVRFVITRADVHAAPLEKLPQTVGAHFARLKLYDCAHAS